MSNKHTRDVYLKNRNFIESEYERQLQQNSLSESGDHLNNNIFHSKENNGNKLEIHDDFGMPINYVKMKDLEESIRKDIISDKNSLHRAITPILMLARFFALLPVQGIQGPNTSYLVFNWFSWPVIYILVVIFSTVMILLLSILKFWRTKLTYFNSAGLMFHGSSLIIYIISIHLARKWPKVMKNWELMELEIRQFGYPQSTASKFKMLASIIMILAIIEHTASILTKMMKAINCSSDGLDIFRVYFLISFRQVFTFFNYSFSLCVFLGFLDLVLACAWNFMDLFIIILACALSDRFNQLNQRLVAIKGKVLPSAYWRQSRETYNLLALITRDLDEFLSPVILLSFANNLYFISLQLLNSLKPMENYWEAIYFVYSFTYLVGRICAVSLYAASINDQSKKPKAILFSIPTESYGVEVARFLMQVTTDELALTGYNFFSVTRTFMLTIAGTIVTYEIVILQFNSVNNTTTNYNGTYNYCHDYLKI